MCSLSNSVLPYCIKGIGLLLEHFDTNFLPVLLVPHWWLYSLRWSNLFNFTTSFQMVGWKQLSTYPDLVCNKANICLLFIITARIRSMTGRYCFYRCLSVNISRGGSQVQVGGVPVSGPGKGGPGLRSGGGVCPSLRSGGGGCPSLRSGGGGYPD